MVVIKRVDYISKLQNILSIKMLICSVHKLWVLIEMVFLSTLRIYVLVEKL